MDVDTVTNITRQTYFIEFKIYKPIKFKTEAKLYLGLENSEAREQFIVSACGTRT